MNDQIDDTDNDISPFEQHLLFNELFADLEACDSKRVDDPIAELDESVVYIINLKGIK